MKDVLYGIASGEANSEELPLNDLSDRARRSGDDELAEFFSSIDEVTEEHAEEARRLLATRLAE